MGGFSRIPVQSGRERGRSSKTRKSRACRESGKTLSHLRSHRCLGLGPLSADSGSARSDAAARPLRPAAGSLGIYSCHAAGNCGDFAGTGGRRILLPPGAQGARVSPDPRPPGRAAIKGETLPAEALARAGPRKEGRRPPRPVRSASPLRRRAGGHTQRPGRRLGLGGPGCGWRGPGSATVPAAQAPPRPPEPRVPARARRAGGERVPGGGGGRGSRAYLCAKRRPLRPGPGNGDRGRGRRWRRGGGGGPCGAEGGRSRSRCLGRAPSGARPAQPALAAEGAAGSAPGLDSFTDTTPGRPAPRRDTPAPRRLPPPAGRPASPPLGVTHPGAHTPSRRPSLPLAHTALLTPLSGFVSAHTHVLTQIPSLHTPSLAPFPPHFLEESPYSFRALPAPHQPPRLSPNPRLT
ncbi:translation initiation factor IF-2-like [Orcinus orca]|uniref:translation initiation factor IF-2-like n=1 Tax=Orcinus orca TaxID=9733 RepID=UPI002111FF5F|nr:translation initiation factor IF-2-like [Orcinus orca]